ncbi:MAG: S-ribosylhomocysteine lyase [Duncaniella sp.]|nr:S-ribosylhomocysteine lyase [Duncaniella sp.]
MEKIPSFTIDHTRLKRGIYVSRRDVTPAGDMMTTFDIRMTEPNRQTPLTPETLHAMEHLAATFLRNQPEWRDRIVYWGPMGCCTGNYLILQGDLKSAEILPLLRETMEFIAGFEGEIPGATERDCGNWTFMDLAGARAAARTFVDEVLADPDINLEYPSSQP